MEVLTGIERIPVCTGYRVGDDVLREMPMRQTEFHRAEPVYEELPGWTEDITGARSFEDLPKNAQAYVEALEDMSGAPIAAIGVGPGRDQTVARNPLFSPASFAAYEGQRIVTARTSPRLPTRRRHA